MANELDVQDTERPIPNKETPELININLINALNTDNGLKNFFVRITKHDIRAFPDNDDNETYYPGQPHFEEDEEGRKFIIIQKIKFHECEEGQEGTGYSYIYDKENNNLYLGYCIKGKFITPYIIAGHEGIKMVEITKYRDYLAENTQRELADSLSLMGCLDLQSLKILRTYYINESKYLDLEAPNLKKEIKCRKYIPNFTGLAYKELDNGKLEIGFYKNGEPIETRECDNDLIEIQDPNGLTIF